ncbi:hypothetical protein FQA39_LY09565 [Lamprigera yunnana]|nr:hypothetical protein FQA39_LY09565 [Lamprigera yunnana]
MLSCFFELRLDNFANLNEVAIVSTLSQLLMGTICSEYLWVLKFAETTQEVHVTKAESRHHQVFKTPTNKGVTKTQRSVIKTGLSCLKIPTVKLDFENYEKNRIVFDNLLKYLPKEKQKTIIIWREIGQKEMNLRKRFFHLNKDRASVDSEVHNLKDKIKKKKLLSQNIDLKIRDLKTNNYNLKLRNKELEERVHDLQLNFEEKNLNYKCLEHKKNKIKLNMETVKLDQVIDEKLRQQKNRLENEIHMKDLKLKKMKEIMNGNDATSPTQIFPTCVQQDINENVVQEHSPFSEMSAQHIINSPRIQHCSTGEVWLEHNVIKPVALSTIMQPNMKKRKFANKLENTFDITNTKQNKYCLIEQEADDYGDLETKLYKGDIVPTSGGGAQVIYNGVECLREELPTPFK